MIQLDGGQQKVININIDGQQLPAGSSVSGITGINSPDAVLLRDVSILKVTNCGVDGTTGGGTWYCERVIVQDAAHDGFLCGWSDSTFTDCLAAGNMNHGWYMYNAINCKFIGCRAEWNSQNGFWVSGDGNATGGVQFVGCSTDRNSKNGMYIDASGNWPILVSGMMFRRDGAGDPNLGYSALQVNGVNPPTCPVIIDGITVFPGYDDGAGGILSPQYGIRVAGTVTYVSAANAFLHAATAGLNGKLSNARAVVTRAGSWDTTKAIAYVADSS